jgi:hypothetical protein
MGAQHADALGCAVNAWKDARRGTGCEQQLVITERLSVSEPDCFGNGLDSGHRRVEPQIDRSFLVSLQRSHELRFDGLDKGLLRQRRALVGGKRFGADQGDVAVEPLFSEREGGACAAFSGADDDEMRHGLFLTVQ